MSKQRQPVALTIAGSDSGGGAGIQADLRAFAYFDVFGASVITVVTAQNPNAVTGVHAVPAAHVRRQIEAVLNAFAVRAIKTGMIFSSRLIRTVVTTLDTFPRLPLVVDPVMVATSGARLLQDDAVAALCAELLPRASLITPNLPEAEILAGRTLRTPHQVQTAAAALARRYHCHVLIKGGHNALEPGTDLLSDGKNAWRFCSPPVVNPLSTHGTGCSLSAAIAANLAQGETMTAAICQAKAYVLGSIRNAREVGPGVFTMYPPARLPLDAISIESCSAGAGSSTHSS